MSPAKFRVDYDQHARKEINGPRPSPLKISKGSHLIHKSSSTSSNSSSISGCSIAAISSNQSRPVVEQRHGPVIIYTHSPKIIHTQARDFMALVQKLTGLHRSSDNNETALPPTSFLPENDDNNETSSDATDENCGGSGGCVKVISSSSAKSPIFKSSSPLFADIPLFTPNSSELFCSPRPYFKYPTDTAFESPNMGSLISPSLMEFMKGLREYGQ